MPISDEVTGHLSQLYAEIEIAINRFSDDLWQREGETDMFRVPAFLAHHTVWCMSLKHLLNIPADHMPNSTCPEYIRENILTRDQVLAILSDISAYTETVYANMADDEYLSKGDHPCEPFGAVIYTIAHTRHHLGQLTQILKENGIDPPGWYPIG